MSSYLSVADVTTRIKRLLETSGMVQNVWIQAEISNFKRHSRGHMYFSLKDDRSRIQSVMFAGSNKNLTFTPEDGMSVLVRGDVTVYEPFGQYQLMVKEMQPDGTGNLFAAYEQLKKKLTAAGYFAQDKKKAIPRLPKHIAVITSPTGAAVRDMITTLRRRYPLVKVTLLPVLVQGPDAAPSIARAIRQADETGWFDTIIAGRGGGSIEDLWAFNEEETVLAAASCRTPVISAVGHETDTTLFDFAADLRAPTPTAAAELAVPDITEMREFVHDRRGRIHRAAAERFERAQDALKRLEQSYAFRYPKRLIEEKEQQLDWMTDRLKQRLQESGSRKREQERSLTNRLHAAHPKKQLERNREQLQERKHQLERAVRKLHQEKASRLELQLSKLDLLSPVQLMRKGYALPYAEDGKLVRSREDAPEKSMLKLRVSDGLLACRVESNTPIQKEDPPHE
ncbi:exodeoxyribonuclease VII large subunit [Alkalicoccus urumqiensis]|uniref:Exodeoxyribonuclease 7 large subunit n=1 Tax=Alkalicoccus urumqiensis TaxID=1548213 RepID=A0A2P6MKC3_ALKUR|nr:exodeoxyribonuclease VII large subunit [Alkalicoccus urumqiensis]PRO66711.1 exodeoxyribonuclease VII large subunit [Alkalicoccus urumqiensis]